MREAKAPKPSSEEGDRDREDREKEDTGNVGRRLQKSSDSEPLRPVLERSDRNHSWKCITERREKERNRRKLQGCFDIKIIKDPPTLLQI